MANPYTAPLTALVTLLAALLASACEVSAASDDPEDSSDSSDWGASDSDPPPPLAGAGAGDADEPDDAPTQERAGAQEVPATFAILSVASGGKGCPDPDLISATLSADKKSLGVTYDALRLDRPGGAKVQYTSCTVSVKVRIPEGWQVSPTSVGMRGHLRLAKGIEGRQTSRLFVAGVPVGAAFQNDFTGAARRDYRITRVVPAEAAVWSPCGGSAILAIQGGLRLDATANPDGAAAFSLRSQRLALWKWRKC